MKKGVLLIHGFTGTSEEMEELAKFLHGHDLVVSLPLLRGHGTRPEDLLNTTPAEWYRSAVQAYEKLRREVDEVYLVGLSFGGNLALKLAANRPVSGVVCLGAPIYFFRQRLLRLSASLLRPFMRYGTKRIYVDYFAEKEGVARRRGYPVVPLKNITEILRFIRRETPRDLKRIPCPILIAYSCSDHAVRPESALYLYRHVRSRIKHLYPIERSYHNLLLDSSRGLVHRRIVQFIAASDAGAPAAEEHAGPSDAPAPSASRGTAVLRR